MPSFLIPNSIDATGALDVTLDMQAFLDSVPDGSDILFPTGASYRIEGSLYLENRNNLKFRGRGARVFATTDGSTAPVSNLPAAITFLWPRKRGQFILRGGSGYIFTDLVVQGANPYNWEQEESYNALYEAQHCFDIEGTHGVLIWRCEMKNPWGDFVYCGMWTAYNSDWSYDITVIGNEMHDNGRQGVSFVGTRNVVVEDNHIYNTRRATFDIEPDGTTSGSYDLHIRKNRVEQGRLLFVASGGQPGDIHNVIIEGNTLTNRALSIACGSTTQGERHNWTIRDNQGDASYLYGSPRALIEMVGVDDVYIFNNEHWFAPMQPGDLPGEGNRAVYLEGTRGYTIEGNIWHDAEKDLDTLGTSPASVTTPPASIPPVAAAGIDQPVNTVSTTLVGTGSDYEGGALSFFWSKLDGPSGGSITSPSSSTTTITALIPGTYLYKLTVTDAAGREAVDHVEVEVVAGSLPTTTTTTSSSTTTTSSSTTTTTAAPGTTTTTTSTTTTTTIPPSTTTTTTKKPDVSKPMLTVDRIVRRCIHIYSRMEGHYKLYGNMTNMKLLSTGVLLEGDNYIDVTAWDYPCFMVKIGTQQFVINIA